MPDDIQYTLFKAAKNKNLSDGTPTNENKIQKMDADLLQKYTIVDQVVDDLVKAVVMEHKHDNDTIVEGGKLLFESVTVEGTIHENDRTSPPEIEVNEPGIEVNGPDFKEKRVYIVGSWLEYSTERPTDQPVASVEVHGAKLAKIVLTSPGSEKMKKTCEEMEKQVAEFSQMTEDTVRMMNTSHRVIGQPRSHQQKLSPIRRRR